MKLHYDVIVIGAGHAGCEAAHAAARMGAKTCLVTIDMNKIAQMSCNPAVGGIAKGQIVREIDALGGGMGIVTDATAIQFRMLNKSKGPAMWSPRAQCDRGKFIWKWREILDNTPNLDIWQDQVIELLTEARSEECRVKSEESHPDGASSDNGNSNSSLFTLHSSLNQSRRAVIGVKTIWGCELYAPAVIVTAGTFLNGLMHVGRKMVPGGRCAEPASLHLTESINALGIRSDRMKTGTPVRIDRRSVHFEDTELQPGEPVTQLFSYLPREQWPKGKAYPGMTYDSLPLWEGWGGSFSCYTFTTNAECHAELLKGLADSPLYNGQIQSIGPRYCPSVETKLVTFPDRDHHPLFLEPEGTDTNEMYLNGFSSSMPMEVQLNALRKIPALRDVKIYRPGYAIEYDFFDPTQLHHSLMSKVVDGLFFAGQVNGTTGYEEAGGQGLVAGVNAALYAGRMGSDKSLNEGDWAFTLARDEAYIGVLIDDLVIKGVDEPYRMFTSRAEYRILLRQDNADERLTERSHALGLATDERYNLWLQKKAAIDAILNHARTTNVSPKDVNDYLASIDSAPLQHGVKLSEIIARPGVSIKDLGPLLLPQRGESDNSQANTHAISADNQAVAVGSQTAESCTFGSFLSQQEAQSEADQSQKASPRGGVEGALECAEIAIKYDGYIRREREAAEKMHRLENIRIPDNYDYTSIQSLSTEARQKLTARRPATLAQASRIPGVSPSDINVLLVLMGR